MGPTRWGPRVVNPPPAPEPRSSARRAEHLCPLRSWGPDGVHRPLRLCGHLLRGPFSVSGRRLRGPRCQVALCTVFCSIRAYIRRPITACHCHPCRSLRRTRRRQPRRVCAPSPCVGESGQQKASVCFRDAHSGSRVFSSLQGAGGSPFCSSRRVQDMVLPVFSGDAEGMRDSDGGRRGLGQATGRG